MTDKNSVMRNQGLLSVISGFIILLLAGCQGPEAGQPGVEPLLGTGELISVHQLARQLGLQVTDVTDTHVTLKNTSNVVIIFTFSGGRVYVNTQPIAETDKVTKKAGQVYVSRSLIGRIRQALVQRTVTAGPTVKRGCVVIDAGHGGHDPGAISVLGYPEKDINLQVALKIAARLRRMGIEVVLTRQSDRFIELEQRAQIANQYKAALFVSIHADSASNRSARGFTVYVARSASWQSQKAAKAIVSALRRTGLESRGIQRADYRVLVHTTGPAVLIELGFVSNRSEAGLLRNSAFQERLAAAIASGIAEYLR